MTIDQILDQLSDEKKSQAKGLGAAGAGAAGLAAVGGVLDPTKPSDLTAGRYSFAIKKKGDKLPIKHAAKDIPTQTLHGRNIIAVNEPGLRVSPEAARRYGFMKAIKGISPRMHEKIAAAMGGNLPVEILKHIVPPTAFLDWRGKKMGDVVEAPNLNMATPGIQDMPLDIEQRYPGRASPAAGTYDPNTFKAWAEMPPLSSAEAVVGTPMHEVHGHAGDDLIGMLREPDPHMAKMADLLSRGDEGLKKKLKLIAYLNESQEVTARAAEKGYMDPLALRQGKHVERAAAYDQDIPASKTKALDAMRDYASRWHAGVREPVRPYDPGLNIEDAGREIFREAVTSAKQAGMLPKGSFIKWEGPSLTEQVEAAKSLGIKEERAWDAARSAFAMDAAQAQRIPITQAAGERMMAAKQLINSALKKAGSAKSLEAILKAIK